MKKILMIVSALGLLVAGTAIADSQAVTSAAGLGGVAQNNCSGDGMPGPCGLEITHDNSSISYVQDSTPANEKVYRAEFLLEIGSVGFSGAPGIFRQAIFTAIGANPRPGVGVCHPTNAFVEAIRCFHIHNPSFVAKPDYLQCRTRGDFCGERSTGTVLFINDEDTDTDGAVKVCVEFESNAGADAGKLRMDVVDDGDACQAPYARVADVTNNDVDVQFVRMGTPQANGFGVGEQVTYYMDEFASFRTLAP